MKRSFILVLTAVLFASLHPAPAQVISTLVEDDFTALAGTAPDAARFIWGGDLSQNGSGWLIFSTDSANTSWLQSRTGAVMSAGSTLNLGFTAAAYAEGWNPGIYGDGQPRGLRVGSDADNAIEFYSAANATVGMRVRNGGVGSDQTHVITPGVASMHLYEISVTSTSAVFKVDGAVTGIFIANLPAGTLNFFVDTFDGYSGNVPVTLDSIRLSLTNAGSAPEITTQPANQTIGIGNNATFAVTATGADPLVYQWFFNSNAIASGTNASLTVSNALTNNAGNYQVIITNDYGCATSSVAVLTIDWATLDSDGDGVVNAADNCPYVFNPDQSDQDGDGIGDVCEDPRITSQPSNQSVNAGATVVFSTATGGTAPFTYQWQKNNTNLVNGGNISGTTTSNLTLSSVTLGDAGGYRCYVSNALDRAVTRVAQLQINLLDSDGDGVPDAADNCPYVYNPSQADHDGNGIGDVCDVPILTSFSPANGSLGTVITVNGANFSAVSGVKLNGTDLPFSVLSDAQLTATVSPGATSGLIVVSNPAGTATSLAEFVIFSPPTDFTYTTNNGTITITGYTGPGGVVIIPDTILGLPVVSIGANVFNNCASLTNITIPNHIANIGSGAFTSCRNLVNLTIPDSVSSIGIQAFSQCRSLTSVAIPVGVTSIESGTFYSCIGLTNLTIPNGVTNIGGGAFAECSGLTNILIPDSVTSIGSSAFAMCTRLVNLMIPDGVTSIGDNAFYQCSGLTNVTISSSVTNIGALAFYYCNSLGTITVDAFNPSYSSADGVLLNKSQTTLLECPGGKAETFIIPNSVTNVGDKAFYHCGRLTGITIHNSVTSIGDSAFAYCGGLTSLTIPNSITSIRDNTLSYCNSLTNLTIPDSVTNLGFRVFYSCSNLRNVTISDSVTSIGEQAFAECGRLASVTLPGSLTSIANTMFFDCTSLTNVTIPNSVTNIGSEVFRWCSSLVNLTIPDSVIGIRSMAFSYCTSLTRVYFQGNAPDVGSYEFYGANNAMVYYLSGTTGWSSTFGDRPTVLVPYTCTINGGTITITGYAGPGGTVIIPDTILGLSVTSIGDGAFFNGASLTSVTLPNSVTSIGDGAFAYCTGLAHVTLGNSVTNIGSWAFLNCTSLTRITLPNTVTGIGMAAFYSCTSLTEVCFRGNAPGVGSYAFYGANHPTVYCLPGTTGWGAAFGGAPTALWKPRMQTSDACFGVRTNRFGFNINWASGMVVVVEASTNLAHPAWSPVGTNTLTDESSYFSDPQWMNHPGRFYRLRSP